MSSEEEKKGSEAESLDSSSESLSMGLPPNFLPKSVHSFYCRDVKNEPFEGDSTYFEALVACESARQMSHRLQRRVRNELFVTSEEKRFAKPNAPFFHRGRDLGDTLAELTKGLDHKRETMVASMANPPLVEKFLDKMDATNNERRIFRYILVMSSSISIDDGDYQSPDSAFRIFQDDIPLPELMALTAIDSKWVEQQIYERDNDASHILPTPSMRSFTLRVFMGLDITPAQYRELDSSILQDTLLEDVRFLQTLTGKLVKQEQDAGYLDVTRGEVSVASDAHGADGFPDMVQAPLARALSETMTGDGRIFKAMAMATQQLEPQMDEEKVEESVSHSSSHDSPSRDSDYGFYRSELDYLEDQIRLMDKETAYCKVKAELEDDGDDDDSPLHVKTSRYKTGVDMTRDEIILERSKEAKKLETKLKKLRERVAIRLRATKKERNRAPRLEQVCDALNLQKFERNVILDLIRMLIMPFHYDMDNLDGLPSGCVAAYIERFTHSLEEKMRCRSYFYKSSTLVKEGLISLSAQDLAGSDLSMCQVYLDRRMFDYLIGLDTEFSELVDGSHLYTPDVCLEDVVLPPEMKQRICESAMNFDKVKDEYHSLEIDKKITYGLGHVLLFYGQSGTGKTMMANALATEMKKKILLVNFPSLGINSSGTIIKLLFREARIKHAILFFDECESLFGSRELGNSEINTVLSELERFDDMCILATNRPCDLDEAMYRRLSLAIEFKKPDHILREKIWKTLRPPKLVLSDDVDYRELARKYELPGGFIKNAWLGSISLMVQRGDHQVTQADLEKAASEQVISRLGNEEFDRGIVASCGVDALVVPEKIEASLRAMVQNTKAQSVLFGQWGFGRVHRAPTGVSALFTGPPGTGKTMAAEAIAFDLGSPLMVLNTANLVSKWVGDTGKNIASVFADAKQKDAVLVFDEAEGLFGTRVQTEDSVGRHDTINVGLLLQHVENHSGMCIVISNQREAIDNAFLRRFRYVLNFERPSASEREKLWKSIIPEECPVAADVSFSHLAKRYDLCGGDIKNAVIRAATAAALRLKEEDRVLSMSDLEESCEEELSKKSSNKSVEMYV